MQEINALRLVDCAGVVFVAYHAYQGALDGVARLSVSSVIALKIVEDYVDDLLLSLKKKKKYIGVYVRDILFPQCRTDKIPQLVKGQKSHIKTYLKFYHLLICCQFYSLHALSVWNKV